MCLAQGPQRSDVGQARSPESSALPLSHCAPNMGSMFDTCSKVFFLELFRILCLVIFSMGSNQYWAGVCVFYVNVWEKLQRLI